GTVVLDPKNPHVIWVGTGENRSQRSVGYGDGVYRSRDGGKSWENLGLKQSEHIGRILIHPEDSDTVYVAAQGPLWAAGGDRGLYKTTDGGKTWKAVLTVSEHTGVTDVVMDPRDPDVLIAAAYQRRRHVFTLINGGPESAIYKSTDAGETWRKITAGLPRQDMGKIGLALSPVNPDIVYAVIEAAPDARGFFRSADRGETWEKRSDYNPGPPMYYAEIYADPFTLDRVYSCDVFLQVTDDGGKTFRNLGELSKHVDNHALWIDPRDPNHYLVGSDGGLYETWDRAATWDFKANLPITQFYRVSVDDQFPVYHVYGGTQDNSSMVGPSRTLTVHGALNFDWTITWGGDGFHTFADPRDPNIVYATLQYGVLARYDRRSGEALLIQPQEEKGEPPLRWNWDSPLLISPHSHTRLYFAANRLFRSDDRGGSWKPISPDLTRQIDRNTLKVMGRVWGPDAVAKGGSTSFYGNIVSLAESPKVEGLLYVGTDDGLIQVSEDGGATWRRQETFPGVPDTTYVSDIVASRHDANVVYAAFNNHKNGDFKPYLARSADRGRTWTAIASNLPENGPTWVLAEDHVDPALLFAGTEFGVFASKDGGKQWTQLKGGLPPIPVRDIAIQTRENDLVLGTFGRGFYVLDDYTPLRAASPASLEQGPAVFPVKKAYGYVPSNPLGMSGKAFQGESLFTAPNPPFGAVFTYYLKDGLKSKKAQRQEAEREAQKKNETPPYPTREQLVAEAREEAPGVVLTVSDASGALVRRLTGPSGAGFQRVAWDLRFPPSNPASLRPLPTDNPFFDPPQGPLVVPGTYRVTVATRVDGVETAIGTQEFEVEALNNATLPAKDRPALLAFQRKTAELQRAVLGSVEAAREMQTRVRHVVKAAADTPGGDPAWLGEARRIDTGLADVLVALRGDEVMQRRNEPVAPSIAGRVGSIVSSHWTTTGPPTGTSLRAYEIAAEEFAPVLERLRALDADLRKLEATLEAAGAPWTPGRVPVWKK
ncbi:MAG: hypothetical protein MUF60_05550, partial [Vicinamibacterales bacterium]|nr:hypothetical protein [Vicinamibacterales bacterium]